MQTIWIVQHNDVEGNGITALFATEAKANEYMKNSDGPFKLEPYGLEGVSAESHLHLALKAVFQLPTSRESSLVKTKIQEAQLWLSVTDPAG
jgi:hypothetical protein